jgi:hypothetical protein
MSLRARIALAISATLVVAVGSLALSRLHANQPARSGALAAASLSAGQATPPESSPSPGQPSAASPTPLPVPLNPAGGAPAGDSQPTFPIRAAFYYPWFPQAWRQQGLSPFTHYHPSLGFYDLSAGVIAEQVAAMRYANIQAAIASWWGQGSSTDQRVPSLLAASGGSSFRWALYDEAEGQSDPSVSQIRADLTYIKARYGSGRTYLRVNGRFVVFVYAQPADGCGMVDRWTQANTVGAYVVLKVFPGYRSCAAQPDAWHQYAPAMGQAPASTSFSISPGFYKATTPTAVLPRSLAGWEAAVRTMVASHARFQLVTTFNEWGEGTAVEGAVEWASPSGYGAYLDVLHRISSSS